MKTTLLSLPTEWVKFCRLREHNYYCSWTVRPFIVGLAFSQRWTFVTERANSKFMNSAFKSAAPPRLVWRPFTVWPINQHAVNFPACNCQPVRDDLPRAFLPRMATHVPVLAVHAAPGSEKRPRKSNRGPVRDYVGALSPFRPQDLQRSKNFQLLLSAAGYDSLRLASIFFMFRLRFLRMVD